MLDFVIFPESDYTSDDTREGIREDDVKMIAVEAGVSVDGLEYIGVEDESNDEDFSEETIETFVNTVVARKRKHVSPVWELGLAIKIDDGDGIQCKICNVIVQSKGCNKLVTF